MKNLKIPRNKYTLEIDFDADNGVLRMAGSSYPENAAAFFKPLYKWLQEYIANVGNSLHLNLTLDYLNTSSTKCIMEVLEILEDYQKKSGLVELNWYYPDDDEDILETGEEIVEDVALKVNFISY